MLSKMLDSAELYELAGQETRLDLVLGAGDLSRLAELVVDAGEVEPRDVDSGSASPQALMVMADVEFDKGRGGFPRLRMAVAGELHLQCQRCLGPVTWPVKIRNSLLVLRRQDEAKQIVDPFDCIVVDADGLSLATVIEDEILAALPLAPMHEQVADCSGVGVVATGLDEISERATEQTHQPFSGLATMVADADKGRRN
jgi:uncharacterized protein